MTSERFSGLKVPSRLVLFVFAVRTFRRHFQFENEQIVELWLNALLANFENQKNENVGSVAITLGKKHEFAIQTYCQFLFYWVAIVIYIHVSICRQAR